MPGVIKTPLAISTEIDAQLAGAPPIGASQLRQVLLDMQVSANPGQFMNVKSDFGAVGDGVANDTTPLQNAANALVASNVSIYLPPGTYKITAPISFAATNKCCYWVGAGISTSVIVPTGAGVNGINLLGPTDNCINFQGFGITGASNTGVGIYSGPTVQYVQNTSWRDLFIEMGGNCIHLEQHFSNLFERIFVTSFNGHGFCLHGGNTVVLINCYAGIIHKAHKSGYRIGSSAALLACNGVDAGDYWGVFGARPVETGTARAGGANTITLAAAPSRVNDEVRSFNIRLTGGTGSGQTRMITALTGASTVATVDSAWGVVPDATTTYSVEDSETMFQTAMYPEVWVLGCNVEACNLNHIRYVQSSRGSSIRDTLLLADNASTFDCFVRGYSGYAPAGESLLLDNVRLSLAGGTTRTGLADIIFEYSPAEIIGIYVLQSTGLVANNYYSLSAAAMLHFNQLRSDGIDLPNLPTANPADGSGAIWANVRVLTQGT